MVIPNSDVQQLLPKCGLESDKKFCKRVSVNLNQNIFNIFA